MTPKELRDELGITQEKMAARLGCSTVHVCHIENGLRTPSIKLAKKYEKISGGKVGLTDFKTN